MFDQSLVNSSAVFSEDVEHYRTKASGSWTETDVNGKTTKHTWSLSGTKDVIDIRAGGVAAQSITKVKLERYNITLDGKNYDVLYMSGKSTSRMLFATDPTDIQVFIALPDNSKTDKENSNSIYTGFFYRNNVIDFLKQEDAKRLSIMGITFGFSALLPDPISSNIADGLMDFLGSKISGQPPKSTVTDEETLRMLLKVIDKGELE
ncbi:MAG: hypothetical protein IK024_04540 [Treponema sp.]|nr:hypothetical protein [Treponema sp.]